jgi:hypothetical protein
MSSLFRLRLPGFSAFTGEAGEAAPNMQASLVLQVCADFYMPGSELTA